MDSIYTFLKNHKGVFLSIFIVWLIFFISVIFLTKDISLSFTPSMTSSNLGVFGDSFNVLTSLFTGLAFAGVIISIVLQTKELQETQKEFKGQKEALEEQNFDNKFFQMLNLLSNVIEKLYYKIPRTGTNDYNGREVIRFIKKDLETKAKSGNILNNFQSIFNEINDRYNTTFKYYFINLYQILNYIDKYANSEKDAKEYTNILRAQLSKDELVLLFYNAYGVIEFSGNRYKNLVEEYALFEHLMYKDLNPDNKNHIVDKLLIEYAEEAFGENIAIKDKRQELILLSQAKRHPIGEYIEG